jgi:hypothetical protein
MDKFKFQNMDTALSFAKVTIADKRKILIFIRGLSSGEDWRYILQQKCGTLDKVYETVIYLRQSKGTAWIGEGRVVEGRTKGTRRKDKRGV